MGWLDLHLHSIYSDDGQYTPKELLSICLHDGVKAAALADHNTVCGVAQAQKEAASIGMELIPAVEMDCLFQGVGLHVLGYWINPQAPAFGEIEADIRAQGQTAAEKRIMLVEALGIHIDVPDVMRLSHNGVVTGEILAESALAQESNNSNPLLSPYRSGGARSDNPYVNFYWDFCAQGKPAHVPIHYRSLEETVDTICQSGGIAVLAHPGNNIGEDAALLRSIVSKGIVGLEAYSSYHTPAQTAFYLEQAQELGLAVSCGSDFHGKTKPSIRAGCVDCGGREAELLAALKACVPCRLI